MIKHRYLSRYLLYFTIAAVFIAMLALPREVRQATLEGVQLVVFRLLPALFPFMVLSGLVAESGFADTMGKAFRRKHSNFPPAYNASLILGILSGFPIGAKISAELLSNGTLTSKQAGRLCALSSLPGPAFVIAFVGSGVLGCTKTGAVIWLSHLLSFWLFSLLTKEKKTESKILLSVEKDEISLPALIRCFTKAAESMLSVGATIVFFTIIARIVQVIFSDLFHNQTVRAGFYGFLELSRGIVAVGEAGLPTSTAVALATIITGWGGMAVHAQVAAFAAPAGVPLKDYFRTRLICPPISAAISVILMVVKGYL